MSRVRPTRIRAAHAVALAAAVTALALSVRDSAFLLPLLVLGVVVLATPFLEWTSVPPVLVRVLPRVHFLLLLVTTLLAWLSRSMGVLVLEPSFIPLTTAPLLVPIAIVFALAPHAFVPGRTFVPAVVYTFVVAGLNPAPAGYGGSRLPFLEGAWHNGFAEVYLPLAALATGALWGAAFMGSGPRWSRRTLVAVAATGLVALGLAAAGVIGLPLAQPLVERAFASALDQGTTGLSGESELGDIGALALSRRRVLDLQSSLHSGGRWRLASEVFTRFDGRRWTNAALPPREEGNPSPAPPQPRSLRPGPAPAGVGRLVGDLGQWFEGASPGAGTSPAAGAPGAGVELRITQAEVASWPLLLPRKTTAVTADAAVLRLDRFGLVRRPHGLPTRQYGALLPTPVRNASEVPQDLSVEEREESLSLPAAVDPRVVALAHRLAPPSAPPRARLDATIRHMQTDYRYSLSPGPFRPDGDPIAEFLFEKRQAYCEYFASAAVLLLRLQGVPARFVKGLSVGPQNDIGGGLHVVRESDAHAWIEAWVPGEGWVEADPTPPGQFELARGTPDRLQRWIERARAGLSAAWRRFTERGPIPFLRWLGGEAVSLAGRAVREPLVWLAVLAFALGPTLVRRLRRLRRRRMRAARDDVAVPADLRDLVQDLERRWAAHGRPRPPARGRLEHARALRCDDDPSPDAPSLPAPLVAASRRVVDAYYRARFGGEPLAPDEVRRLRDSLRD